MSVKFQPNKAAWAEYTKKANQLNAEMKTLSESLPERTTTKEEKENAIKVKNQIAEKKREIIELSKKNNPSVVAELESELAMILSEKDTVAAELSKMRGSVFNETPRNINPQASIWNNATS